MAAKLAKVGPDGKKRRTKNRKETYSIYIFKCLKMVNPELGLSRKAMITLNSFVTDQFDKIAYEAARLVSKGKGQTLNFRTIKAAVSLSLPGELGKHAQAEAEKSCSKFDSTA